MIQRVLGIIAGVDRKTLSGCPASDKLWAAHLGASLCLSFIVVIGVSFHATGYMIDNIWTRLMVSGVIALTVLMFDRALCQSDWFYQGTLWNTSPIVSNAEAKQTAWRFVRVGIRLSMSFGLAWVIAMFLELAIFSSTINERIEVERVAANQPIYAKIASYEDQLNAEVARRQASVDQIEAVHRAALTEIPAPEPTTKARLDDLDQQMKTLVDRESEIRNEIGEIDKTIQRYTEEMNAEEFGMKATPSNSGRPGAGPRYEFARKQKAAFQAQRVERESDINKLHAKRDELRAAQAKVTTEALAAREHERVAIKAKADALQQRVDDARNELKQFEAAKAVNVADFRRKALNESYYQDKKDRVDPLTRIAAYQELKNDPKDGATITLFSWMTRFFIIFLEIVPVVAKIFFSPPSVYAAKIQAEVERARQRIENNEDLEDKVEPAPAPAPIATITLPAMALSPIEIAKDVKAQVAPAQPTAAASYAPAQPDPAELLGRHPAQRDDYADDRRDRDRYDRPAARVRYRDEAHPDDVSREFDERRRRSRDDRYDDDHRDHDFREQARARDEDRRGFRPQEHDDGYVGRREFDRPRAGRRASERAALDHGDVAPRDERDSPRRRKPQFVARDYALQDFEAAFFHEPERDTEIDVRNLIMPRHGAPRRGTASPAGNLRLASDNDQDSGRVLNRLDADRDLRWPDLPTDDHHVDELVRQVLDETDRPHAATAHQAEDPIADAMSEPAPAEPVDAIDVLASAIPVEDDPSEIPAVAVAQDRQSAALELAAVDAAMVGDTLVNGHSAQKYSADVEKLMHEAVELSRTRKKAARTRREADSGSDAELPLNHALQHSSIPKRAEG